ncbi:MAG: Trk system potassium transporter TrkA [Puniceicoccales bacterium]|nr:Trk system potassium transporter TrkA [Puniceicoccales bacterium]
MRIIIGGIGEIGDFLCMTLTDQKHDVIAIDEDPNIADVLQNKYTVAIVTGDIKNVDVMRSAGIDKCDFFLSVSSDASANIIGASMAKSLGAKNTVARIDSSMSVNDCGDDGFDCQRHFAINMLIDPDKICASEFAKVIRNPGRMAVENIAFNQIEVRKCSVGAKAKIKRSLRDLGISINARIVAIFRNGVGTIPTSDTTLEEGDVITVVGKHDDIILLLEKLGIENVKSMEDITIFGASGITRALLRYLKSTQYRIKVIEESLEECEKLSSEFPQVTVIHGDATTLDLLKEEYVCHSSYFVACSNDDEKNTMVAIQAKYIGAKCVLLALNYGKYESVLSNIKNVLGVEKIVSKRVATANEIIHYISTKNFRIIEEITDQNCTFIEFNIGKFCPLIGKSIRALGFPRGCVLISLMRNFDAKVPSANDIILENDRVVAAVRSDAVNVVVNMFTQKQC